MGSVVLATIVLGAFAWQCVKPSYSSEFLDAHWAAPAGEKDGLVTGQIVNWNGSPANDLAVEIEGDGATRASRTDGDGRFNFPTVVRQPRQLNVVGIDSIPLTMLNRRGDAGMSFEIHLKRPAPPSKGPL